MMQLRVGGTLLSSAGVLWGELAWSTDERGCKEASWSVHVVGRHPLLTSGALVEILHGPVVIWSGFLDDLDWAEGVFSAKGFAYAAEDFVAVNTSDAPTSIATAAIDGAIANGWRVTRGTGFPTTPYAATADGSLKVGALLDSVADEAGQRWSVGADRVVKMQADPTTPTWVIRPGVVELSNTSEEYASSIVVTYLNPSSVVSGLTCDDAEAAARFDVVQFSLDLTALGPMTSTRATNYGNGVLAKGKARLGWSSAIEVTAHDLLTPGGVPADLALVESGQLVRIFVDYDDVMALNGATYLDVAIGSTEYADGSEVLTIGPVNSVAQTLAEFAAKITEEAQAA